MTTENTSYDVYLWQDRSGDFVDKAVEVFDGKGEVRLHEGEPPRLELPPMLPCYGCGTTAWDLDLTNLTARCGRCGEKFSRERMHDVA
jgi:hypothetical protein